MPDKCAESEVPAAPRRAVEQRRQRYLALDAILPGDTILSSARSLQSLAIRVFTGSIRASHAAIAIHPILWFESIGKGVDYKLIKPRLIWDGQRVRLAMPIPKGERYWVRRPKQPLFDGRSAQERDSIAKALIDVTTRFAFLNYAAPSEFLAMIKFGLGKMAWARFAAAALDRHQKRFFPGPFCSWLVAECYRDIGRSISSLEPQTITPAALERSPEFVSIPATVTEVAIDKSVRWIAWEKDFRLAHFAASSVLESVSTGALTAKMGTVLNNVLHDFFGDSLPPQITEVFKGMEEQQRENFREWQRKSREAVYRAYPTITFHTDDIDYLSQCQSGCATVASRLSACPGNCCDLMMQGSKESHSRLAALFPNSIPEWPQ